jgi:hypothetical protein
MPSVPHSGRFSFRPSPNTPVFVIASVTHSKCYPTSPPISGPSRAIEFATLHCISQLLKTYTKSLFGALLNAFVDRMEQSPAVEYVTLSRLVLECCTSAAFEGMILPMIARFLTRADPWQYAIGELLAAHRFTIISNQAPSPDLFARFLSAPVPVNEYLPELLTLAIEAAGVSEDWVCRAFPMALLQAG